MKKLILFFIVLLLAVGMGLLIHNHPAYVFVTIGHMSLQASLWFVLVALIVGIFLIQQIIKVLRGIYHIPSHLQQFIAQRRGRTAGALTQKALRALVEERWDAAETYFNKSAKKQSSPFFYYIAAAQAAFAQKKSEPANHYLKKAQKVAKSSEALTLEIMRARLQLLSGDNQQALVTLSLLQKISPRHPFVLIGLKDVYVALQNWQKLYELLPQLRQYTTLDAIVLDQLELQVLSALLNQAAQSKSPAAFEESWQSIPKKWRGKPQLLAIYVKSLMTRNQHEKAEKILKLALKKDHDAVLLQQYAQLNSEDSVKQLARAESWLKQDEHNPDLLFCLGHLCARHRLWGKAKTYLEASLRYKSRPDIYPILGQVLEQLDQKQAALDCYKTGLNFICKD